eukprot:365388-Chlamydomonas_euryale.AAC.1
MPAATSVVARTPKLHCSAHAHVRACADQSQISQIRARSARSEPDQADQSQISQIRARSGKPEPDQPDQAAGSARPSSRIRQPLCEYWCGRCVSGVTHRVVQTNITLEREEAGLESFCHGNMRWGTGAWCDQVPLRAGAGWQARKLRLRLFIRTVSVEVAVQARDIRTCMQIAVCACKKAYVHADSLTCTRTHASTHLRQELCPGCLAARAKVRDAAIGACAACATARTSRGASTGTVGALAPGAAVVASTAACMAVCMAICMAVGTAICMADSVAVCMAAGPAACMAVCMADSMAVCMAVGTTVCMADSMAVCMAVGTTVCMAVGTAV